ncbi:MAG: WD40 repeat domain-containing protein [Candidatus Poribacteria bacterium]|nr:WD40 repeat domain-containing protein [Candidatus Poribacteria bacterium]
MMKSTRFTLIFMLTLIATLYTSKTFAELRTLRGHEGSIYSLVFSPDDQTLASADPNGSTVILWDFATGSEKARLGDPLGWVYGMAFSPDGQTLTTVGRGREGVLQTIMWDFATGTTKTVTLGDPLDSSGGETGLSPDGRTLVLVDGYTVTFWDVATGSEKASNRGDNSITRLVFSPDGQTLATLGGDRRIILWDVATGSEKARLSGHEGSIYFIVFSPDGNTLISRMEGGTVILWDVATGTKTATLPWKPFGILFSPDGQTLAGRDGNTIILLEIPATEVRMTSFPAESPSIGAELAINVAIIAGQNVGGYQVSVEFDETALRYVESANGDYSPPGAFAVPQIYEVIK